VVITEKVAREETPSPFFLFVFSAAIRPASSWKVLEPKGFTLFVSYLCPM
jgi:hypothetical protein